MTAAGEYTLSKGYLKSVLVGVYFRDVYLLAGWRSMKFGEVNGVQFSNLGVSG